jgi:hypothetical protein
MENAMTKITAIVAIAAALGFASAASAQTNRHTGAQWQAPYVKTFNS